MQYPVNTSKLIALFIFTIHTSVLFILFVFRAPSDECLLDVGIDVCRRCVFQESTVCTINKPVCRLLIQHQRFLAQVKAAYNIPRTTLISEDGLKKLAEVILIMYRSGDVTIPVLVKFAPSICAFSQSSKIVSLRIRMFAIPQKRGATVYSLRVKDCPPDK